MRPTLLPSLRVISLGNVVSPRGQYPRSHTSAPISFPPAPPLVGVELNPGPATSRTQKKKKLLQVEKSIASAALVEKPHARARARLPARQKKQTAKRHVTMGSEASVLRRPQASLQNYLNTLRDPWVFPPVKLGWGCYLPTSIRTAYSRVVGIPLGTDTEFLVRLAPTAWQQTGSITTVAYMNYVASNTSATVIGLSGTSLATAASNSASLQTLIDTYRVISGSLRVVVRWPMASARGSLLGNLFYSKTAPLTDLTYAQFISLEQAIPGHSSAAGEMVFDVAYRPIDPSCFNFNAIAGLPDADYPQLVIAGVGWPSGTVIDVYAITHLESHLGYDSAAGGDNADASGGSLADAGVQQDQAARAVQNENIPAVTTSANVLDAIDATAKVINDSLMGRTGFNFGAPLGRRRALPPLEVDDHRPGQANSSAASAAPAPSTSRRYF